jgi:hypothetical protein
LKEIMDADESALLSLCDRLAERLVNEMLIVSRPNPGVLAILTTSSSPEAAGPEFVSILKLDATKEAARFRRSTRSEIRLQVLKDLLPAPNVLQKGISWPDPREDFEVIIRDRNVELARYFLNAYEVEVSPKAGDVEKAVLSSVSKLPPAQVPVAHRRAAQLSGSVADVVSTLKREFPVR